MGRKGTYIDILYNMILYNQVDASKFDDLTLPGLVPEKEKLIRFSPR